MSSPKDLRRMGASSNRWPDEWILFFSGHPLVRFAVIGRVPLCAHYVTGNCSMFPLENHRLDNVGDFFS